MRLESPGRGSALKIQANAHTSFYQGSDFRQLDAASVQLTMGGTVALSKTMALDIGVTEDVVVNTSPDVVFHLSLSRRL